MLLFFMLYKKIGLPEESEIVLCTVTSVQHHSVFCTLDEYNLQGMLHISEVAPGRIRNIREFVKEGKVVVCKVLRVNKERGQVDLSLRRVTDMQRKSKINELKQEQKAEKILEYVAREMKKSVADLYKQITPPILKEYPYIFLCFDEVVNNNLDLKKFGIDATLAKKLEEIIRQRIKTPEVIITGTLQLSTYAADGITLIKTALGYFEKAGLDVSYLGGGKYRIVAVAKDYKSAEEKLEKPVEESLTYFTSHKGEASFARTETN